MNFMNRFKLIATTMLLLATSVANADRLAPGYQHTLVIDDNNNVIAMGGSTRGELGPNAQPFTETINGMAPIHVGIKAKDAAASFTNSSAVLLDGSVVIWGRNVGSQLADDTATPHEIGSFTNAVEVSASFFEVYITDANGDVFEFSYHDGSIRQLPISNVVDINAGSYHAMFLTANGDVYSKGSNVYGQLCLGDNVDRIDPTLTTITNATSVSASKKFSLVSLNDGTVMGCGDNTYNVLGSYELDTTVPVLNEYFGEGVAEVENHGFGSFALMTDGTVYAWGWANYIGNGMYNRVLDRAVQITELSSIVEISAGNNSVMFRNIDGEVTGFVSNINGMLGDGTNTERHSPVAMLPPTPLPIEVVMPVIVEVNPGGSYIVAGTAFGDVEGLVLVDGVEMVLKSWTSTAVHIENPLVETTGMLTVVTADGLISNEILVTLEIDAPTATVIEPIVIVEDVIIEAPALDCKRGWGYGDKNHCHSGPKGNGKVNGKK